MKRSHNYNKTGNHVPPCSFYKLLVNPTMLQKLRLPVSFAKQFGNKLEKTCYLQAPIGEIHPVALVKEGGELLFKRGWDEFVKRYSVGCGNFINFEYKGNSKFNVSIFDISACEIPYDGDGGTSSSRMQGDDTDDDSKYFGPGNLSPSSENEESFDEEETEMSNEDDEIMSEESRGMSDTGVPRWIMETYLKELKCIVAAGIPMPKNPFFVASMVSFAFKKNSSFLNIPRAFARQDFTCKAGTLVTLEMSDGRQWNVKCCRNTNNCSLGKGWVDFVNQSGIKLGDVCLFELTDAKNWVFKVQVAEGPEAS